jgi:hypothetical protein
MIRLAGLAAFCCVLVARPAGAAVLGGGALNAPGQRSHNVTLGWPEVSYAWEFLVRERAAYAIRVSVQIWPLAASLRPTFRLSLREEKKVSVALLLAPSLNFAGYGGTRATYPLAFGYGRSRTFRPSLGPGFDFGVLASVSLSWRTSLLLSLENPVVLWIWTDPVAWWLEWPVTGAVGVERQVTPFTSIWGRFGGGPAIAFSGPSQLLGVHWHLLVGAQFRY